MRCIGTGRDRTASGYITESACYKARGCEVCPLRGSCFKALGNRIIEVPRRLNQYKQRDGKGCSRKKASGIGEGDVLNRKRFLDG